MRAEKLSGANMKYHRERASLIYTNRSERKGERRKRGKGAGEWNFSRLHLLLGGEKGPAYN